MVGIFRLKKAGSHAHAPALEEAFLCFLHCDVKIWIDLGETDEITSDTPMHLVDPGAGERWADLL